MKKLRLCLLCLAFLATPIPLAAQDQGAEEPPVEAPAEVRSPDAGTPSEEPPPADQTGEPTTSGVAGAPDAAAEDAATDDPTTAAQESPETDGTSDTAVASPPDAAESEVAAPSEPADGAAGEEGDDRVELALSLEDAIRMAMENNLGVRIARVDELVSEREIVVARSAFDPFFNVNATYNKNRDPTVSTIDVGGALTQGVQVNPSEATSYSAGLAGTTTLGSTYNVTLQQNEFDRPNVNPLFTVLNPVTQTRAFADLRQPLLKGAWYAVNTADVRIAQNIFQFSREGFELVLMDTVFQVESAYWQLVFATQNLIAREKARSLALEDLENARKRRDVGSFSDNDVTTVESNWVLRKVDYEVAELLVENSRDGLLDLVNYVGDRSLRDAWRSGSMTGPYDQMKVVCTTEPSREPPLDRDAALASAFSMRPDYRQIDLSLRNQGIRVEVARNGLLPQVDVFGRWTQLGLEETWGESYSSMGDGRFYNWLVGVELSVPLSNRGPRNLYRNAREELTRLQLQKKDLENKIVLEIDLAIRTIKNLNTRVIDLEEDVRLKQQLLEDEKSKLEVGRTIAYTVSTIENDLVTSETEALRANADLQTAKADFYRATGTLLRRHNVWVSE